ncbi:MAG TPA: pantoate--beta-alanine ligase [Ilumatobacter sp.]|nr:pantoate--beta-alanine ligase [Ilumatobacter sp.]
MELLRTPEVARVWSSNVHLRNEKLAIVPTMGALHEGHLELVAQARAAADRVIVTIFVNPLQFNQRADFDAYPRPIDGDLDVCRAIGVDAVYAPTAAVMYPRNYQTHVEPGVLADRLEGPMRPGHFRGVSTVVLKLFAVTRPHVGVFGEKDYQQLAIIRQMVADFDLGIDIVAAPISRESDGLARSSRNVRLDPDQRRAARVLSEALDEAVIAWRAGEHRVSQLIATAQEMIEAAPLARLEYVEFVDGVTLESVDDAGDGGVMLTAAWFGEVRLIDNHVFAR